MGMDAEIFVRYVGEPPTQEQIDKWNKDFNYRIITHSFDEIYECTISVAKDMGYRYYYRELLKETEGFVILDMDVQTRYFSEGYSRGNILYLCCVAEWIEHTFKDFSFEILYGSPESNFVLFDEEYRRKMKNYFFDTLPLPTMC